jgi:UrcA family protein
MKRAPIVIPMALLMSVSLVAATAADARPQTREPERRTELVGYGDLDLATTPGVRALDRRISAAIDRLCERGGVRDLSSYTAERRCRDEARQSATNQRGQAIASANPGSVQLSSSR